MKAVAVVPQRKEFEYVKCQDRFVTRKIVERNSNSSGTIFYKA